MFVKDVYVSNKHRSRVTCLFAFVRFEDAGDARRAIDRLYGGLWKGRKILVSMSKYRRRYGRDAKGHADESTRRKGVENDGYNNGNTRTRKLWVEVQRAKLAMVMLANRDEGKTKHKKREIIAIGCETQQERLKRSLLGVSVKPREFKMIEEQIHRSWEGSGRVECRDIGPHRCLLTFDSVQTKEDAMAVSSLSSIFDEVIPHWDFVWSRSRRVWVEVMGIPIHAWSMETFENIERIDEWFDLKVDGREFEINVNEVSGEIYSFQSHPSRIESIEEGSLPSVSGSKVMESPAFLLAAPACEDDGISKISNVTGEPVIEESLNKELENMNDVNEINGGAVAVARKWKRRCLRRVGFLMWKISLKHWVIGFTWKNEIQPIQSDENKDPISSESIPYPPDFGPDVIPGHGLCVDRSHPSSLLDVESETDTANPNPNLVNSEDRCTKREEAIKAQEICVKGGFFFRVRNEDDLLVRLAGRKLQNQKKGDAEGRRKSPVNIRGKTMSTRILRLDAKQKLK
ncbi:hypothetical protein PIB30_064852 [Stylosanthes scabra]|uniref:RRM domain-containing protein n=1 Tax=Stylosanthes scabra TaxID=79078 RepID=A0ABU6ULE7_9FABA|nr:hypothetical protein [Stylosanthes scabra]